MKYFDGTLADQYTRTFDVTTPLEGVRVAVTHDRDQAHELSRLLKAKGAEVLHYPAIELAPFERTEELDQALELALAGGYDWMIFNDADTILVVADRMRALHLDPKRLPRGMRIATIGCMTEHWMKELWHMTSDFAPEVYESEKVVAELGLQEGDRVLLPQSSMTRATLGKCLLDTGAQVHAINAYRTLIGRGGDPLPRMLWEGSLDAITFTFPTAVRYFARRLKAEGGTLAMLDNVTVVCIGPLTAAAARDMDIHVDYVPEQHTISGMVDCIVTAQASR